MGDKHHSTAARILEFTSIINEVEPDWKERGYLSSTTIKTIMERTNLTSTRVYKILKDTEYKTLTQLHGKSRAVKAKEYERYLIRFLGEGANLEDYKINGNKVIPGSIIMELADELNIKPCTIEAALRSELNYRCTNAIHYAKKGKKPEKKEEQVVKETRVKNDKFSPLYESFTAKELYEAGFPENLIKRNKGFDLKINENSAIIREANLKHPYMLHKLLGLSFDDVSSITAFPKIDIIGDESVQLINRTTSKRLDELVTKEEISSIINSIDEQERDINSIPDTYKLGNSITSSTRIKEIMESDAENLAHYFEGISGQNWKGDRRCVSSLDVVKSALRYRRFFNRIANSKDYSCLSQGNIWTMMAIISSIPDLANVETVQNIIDSTMQQYTKQATVGNIDILLKGLLDKDFKDKGKVLFYINKSALKIVAPTITEKLPSIVPHTKFSSNKEKTLNSLKNGKTTKIEDQNENKINASIQEDDAVRELIKMYRIIGKIDAINRKNIARVRHAMALDQYDFRGAGKRPYEIIPDKEQFQLLYDSAETYLQLFPEIPLPIDASRTMNPAYSGIARTLTTAYPSLAQPNIQESINIHEQRINKCNLDH